MMIVWCLQAFFIAMNKKKTVTQTFGNFCPQKRHHAKKKIHPEFWCRRGSNGFKPVIIRPVIFSSKTKNSHGGHRPSWFGYVG